MYKRQVMVPAAIATSIDAFAVGITLSALNVKIIPSATLIGTTTSVSYTHLTQALLASIIPNQNNFGITTVLAIPHDGGSGRYRGTESL